jgi:hypothetical protein
MLHEVNKWSQEPASLFDNLHQFLRRADAESNSTDGGFERHLWQSVHCLFLLTSGVGGLVWVPIVRACNEGSPRPRVARAQGIGRLPFFPFFSLSSSLVLEGVAKVALDCAHRTRAFLGRAFCEQGGHLATPCPTLASPSPPPVQYSYSSLTHWLSYWFGPV